MACYTLKKDCKRLGERLDWAFNWTYELSRKWAANMPFEAGVALRPSTPDAQTAMEYVSSGGQTGPDEPQWPSEAGATVVSGSIIFTARLLTISSLIDQINTGEWTCTDGSIVINDEAVTSLPGLQQTSAFIAGGSLRRTHDVVNHMTTLGGKAYEAVLRLTIDP